MTLNIGARLRIWRKSSNLQGTFKVSIEQTSKSEAAEIIRCAAADEFDIVQDRADTAEAQVEELKAQLDDALGAEDILDQLTERNLTLSEVCYAGQPPLENQAETLR